MKYLSLLFLWGCFALGNTASLKPCPESPNCVGTFEKGEIHRIESIAASKSVDETKAIVKDVAEKMGWKLEKEEPHYLHFVATTAILRFKDDVEFFVEESTKTLHFRSASRMGHSDFGKNRSRMEDFRLRFLQSGV